MQADADADRCTAEWSTATTFQLSVGESERAASQLQRDGPAWVAGALAAACVKLQLSAAYIGPEGGLGRSAREARQEEEVSK
jgi:hypothetical protein